MKSENIKQELIVNKEYSSVNSISKNSLSLSKNASFNIANSNDDSKIPTIKENKAVSTVTIQDKFLQIPSTEIFNKPLSNINNSGTGNSIAGFKIIYDMSAKLLSFDDDCATLECLVDPELKIYEERVFPINLFQGYLLEIGKLFKVCIYEGINGMIIIILDNPLLIAPSAFPSIDFYEKYKNMKLIKKN